MSIIFLDGQYLKVNTQLLDTFTPGIFKEKGVFETMLGLDGVVLDADLHLKRLRAGLEELAIKPPVIKPLALKEILQRNRFSCARVRLMVWQSGKEIHVLIAAFAYKIPDDRNYRVCYLRTNRPANARSANVKSLDYGLFSEAYANAHAQGFDEALLLNRKGDIFEGSRSNIFWIKDKVLYTPPLSSGCLNGITRQQVIKLARNLKVPVKEKNLTPQILKKADTAFLTNSLIGIKPIDIAIKNSPALP